MTDRDSDKDPSSKMEPRATLASWWRDIEVAARFLTRIPLPGGEQPSDGGNDEDEEDAEISVLPEGLLAQASRAFPLVGLGIGLFGAIILIFARSVGLGPVLSAVLGIAAIIAITGGLHEDGLADAADGLAAGRDREAKLAIMRDTRIGAFAVLALILSVLLRVGALAAIPGTYAAAAALIAAAVFSRAVLPVVMAALEPARMGGLAVAAGKPPQDRVIAAGLLGIVLVLLFLGPGTGIIALLAGVGAAAAAALFAQQQLGGYTGDVLGAIQQVTEIAVLLAAAAS